MLRTYPAKLNVVPCIFTMWKQWNNPLPGGRLFHWWIVYIVMQGWYRCTNFRSIFEMSKTRDTCQIVSHTEGYIWSREVQTRLVLFQSQWRLMLLPKFTAVHGEHDKRFWRLITLWLTKDCNISLQEILTPAEVGQKYCQNHFPIHHFKHRIINMKKNPTT